MTDRLNLVAEDLTTGNPETIELCRKTQVQTPVIDIIESADGIAHLTLFILIPRLMDLAEIGTVSEAERGSHVQITEKREVAFDGNLMKHTILPVLIQLRL